MKTLNFVPLFFLCAAFVSAQDVPMTIKAGSLLDGKGGVSHNVTITVRGAAIQSVVASTRAATCKPGADVAEGQVPGAAQPELGLDQEHPPGICH